MRDTHAIRGIAIAIGLSIVGCAASQPDEGHPVAARGSELYGINVAADGARSDNVSALAASWVRLELRDDSEGPDLDPAVADGLTATLADYHARGVKVLLIVDYATHGGNAGFGSHAGGEAPCGDWEGWKAAWLGRLWNVAARFGDRVDAWEIWNEPDQPLLACGEDGYNPGMPSDYYGILLRDAYLAIRDAGAQGPVITGGLDSGNVLYIVDAGTAAGGIWADGVSIHPYGVVPDPSWCPDPGEDLNCDWGTLGGKVDEYSGWTGLPVWITEWGVKTTDTVHAARYLTSGYAAFASRGDRVAHAFFFCESDAMVFPFGLTFDDGSPKPDVFDAFAGLAHGARDLDDRTGSLHGTVETDGSGTPGIWVSAWGHLNGDFHIVQTDGLGIYAFTDLDPSQLYNVVVNAELDPSAPGGFAVRDDGHAFEVRNDVTLISGPDGWHGEDFQLPF